MSDRVFIVFWISQRGNRRIEGVFRTLQAAIEAYPNRKSYDIEEWTVNQ